VKAMRYVIQVGTFLFFAVYFLCLVFDKPFRIPQFRSPVRQTPVQVESSVKPSPIEMLKRVQ